MRYLVSIWESNESLPMMNQHWRHSRDYVQKWCHDCVQRRYQRVSAAIHSKHVDPKHRRDCHRNHWQSMNSTRPQSEQHSHRIDEQRPIHHRTIPSRVLLWWRPTYTECAPLLLKIVDIDAGVIRTSDNLGAIGRILKGEDGETVWTWMKTKSMNTGPLSVLIQFYQVN